MLSAVAGLLLAPSPHPSVIFYLAAGIFLLAAGAGALNHYQERQTDALMARTADRPLPQRKIKPAPALLFSLFLICLGALVLLMTGRPATVLLGLFTVLLYNGFYTWFKRRSPFAAIPGALVGALPPAIGWVAGDGNIFDFRLAVLCFFFFMWQNFHFLIHMLAWGKEYEKAGLPSITTIFTENQLNRLTFQWLLAASVSTQFIALFDVTHLPFTHFAVLWVSLLFVFMGLTRIRQTQKVYAGIFRRTIYYMLTVIILMAADGFFRFINFPIRQLMD